MLAPAKLEKPINQKTWGNTGRSVSMQASQWSITHCGRLSTCRNIETGVILPERGHQEKQQAHCWASNLHYKSASQFIIPYVEGLGLIRPVHKPVNCALQGVDWVQTEKFVDGFREPGSVIYDETSKRYADDDLLDWKWSAAYSGKRNVQLVTNIIAHQPDWVVESDIIWMAICDTLPVSLPLT